MKYIDDLFDWLLEDIFKKLTRKDRLICKEVCRRWYNILMKRVTFQDDRHIYLNMDQIIAGEAPMSVLMEAKHPYQSYTIRHTKPIHDKTILEDSYKFFKHVGKSIESFYYTGNTEISTALIVLVTMPSLKILKLDILMGKVAQLFSHIKRKALNCAFNNLKQLVIGGINNEWNSAISGIKTIKELIPKNCSIIMKTVTVKGDYAETLCELMKEVTLIERIVIDADKLSPTEFEKFLVNDNIKCGRLFLLYCNNLASQHHPYSFLEALQNKHELLNEVQLKSNRLPPATINLPKMKGLWLKLSAPFPSLESLGKLTNLETLCLEFENNTADCDFGHVSIILPKLKQLTLVVNTSCPQCFEALADSFDNIVNLELKTTSTFTWNKFKKLINKWEKIVSINLETLLLANEEDDLNFSFKQKKNLRTLQIEKISNLDKETMEKTAQLFPNLKEFKLRTHDSISAVSLYIKAVVPFFFLSKINKFTVFFTSTNADDVEQLLFYESKFISDYLNNIGISQDARDFKYDSTSNSVTLTLDRKKLPEAHQQSYIAKLLLREVFSPVTFPL